MALKKKPSTWSKWPLIALRLVQLLGIIIVFGVTGYFNYFLLKDGYKIPWEFIVLDVVVRSTHIYYDLKRLVLIALKFRQQ